MPTEFVYDGSIDPECVKSGCPESCGGFGGQVSGFGCGACCDCLGGCRIAYYRQQEAVVLEVKRDHES
jgi:hypothetical protein